MPSKADQKHAIWRHSSGSRRAFLQLTTTAALVSAAFALSAPSAAKKGAKLKVVALGDSLIAGFGLPASAAFPAVLERELRREGYHVEVFNAGVSGDTASAGQTRLSWATGDGADGVILELGANDMLRGIDPEVTEKALDAILATLKERNIKVLIAGMKASPSLGPEYKARFDAVYPALANKYDAAFYPFFLEGVAEDPSLKLGDGLHPNPAGVERIVQNMLPTVRAFLAGLSEKSEGGQ